MPIAQKQIAIGNLGDGLTKENDLSSFLIGIRDSNATYDGVIALSGADATDGLFTFLNSGRVDVYGNDHAVLPGTVHIGASGVGDVAIIAGASYILGSFQDNGAVGLGNNVAIGGITTNISLDPVVGEASSITANNGVQTATLRCRANGDLELESTTGIYKMGLSSALPVLNNANLNHQFLAVDAVTNNIERVQAFPAISALPATIGAVNWDVLTGTNRIVTPTGNMTITMVNGSTDSRTATGLLHISQGATAFTITLPGIAETTTGLIVGGVLTVPANTEAVLSFAYDGTTYKWNVAEYA